MNVGVNVLHGGDEGGVNPYPHAPLDNRADGDTSHEWWRAGIGRLSIDRPQLVDSRAGLPLRKSTPHTSGEKSRGCFWGMSHVGCGLWS